MSALHQAERLALDAARRRDAALAGDQAQRRAGGVVHTPPELARWVVDGVDVLLREQFERPLGVCDPRVQLIDPACGPGAFLAATLRLWHARERPPGARLCGLELDRAALASARELAALAPEAFRLIEADTLRQPNLQAQLPPMAADDVLVLAGNPPWAVARAHATPAMQALLEDFRRDAHGERLAERKLGVLSDAYVRFMRVCAEAVRRNPAGGVVGLITNGSFLDGPVHRGMRGALLCWFDAVYVVDLGGSALLSRSATNVRRLPEEDAESVRSGRDGADGSERDENVFGVRTSVAITFLVRRPGASAAHGGRCGRLYYARLSGSRRNKLALLERTPFASLAFGEIAPAPPFLRYVPPPLELRTRENAEVPSTGAGGVRARVADTSRGMVTWSDYERWPALSDAMPFHREGVQTNRDRAAVDRELARLLERLRVFASGGADPLLAQADRDSPHYSAKRARRAVAAALERDPDGSAGISARRIAYRPYDLRWFSPVAPLCHRPRPDLLRAIDLEPSVLISVRKDRGSAAYTHFGAATCAIDNCFLSTRSSCRSRAFPLRTAEGAENLAPDLRADCEGAVGSSVCAEDYQHYALAWLASAAYREHFDAALRVDYPRIPIPRERAHWTALVANGRALFGLLTEPLARPLPEPVMSSRRRIAATVVDGTQASVEHALQFWIGHTRPLAAELARRAGDCQHPAIAPLAARLHALDGRIRESDTLVREFGYLP